MNAPDYLNPDIPANTKRVSIPMVDATAESLRGYGGLVESPDDFPIEIVRWPAKGWRPVDKESGDEARNDRRDFHVRMAWRYSFRPQ